MKERKKNWIKVVGGVVAVGIVIGAAIFAGPHLFVFVKEIGHVGSKVGTLSIVKEYQSAWQSVQSKVETLRRSELENERLKRENANLRIQLEGLHFDCRSETASARTGEVSLKIQEKAGSAMARLPESIRYRPPSHLLPPQLYTLGVTYFKAREDEKAAVILSFLTDLKDNSAYKTPENLLMAAIAWYRLDHLELADSYLEQVLGLKDVPENLPYHAKTRLWKAIVAKKMGKPLKAQYWLVELLDHHPLSREAAWINGGGKEVTRVPAEATE